MRLLLLAIMLFAPLSARRRPRKKRRPRRLWRAGRIAHVAKGVPYHVGNSIRSLLWQWKARKRKTDRDVMRTKDGVWVNTHWPKPMKHGFHDPLGTLNPNLRIDQMTWAQVQRLEADPDNYKIPSMEAIFAATAKLPGVMAIVVEPKNGRTLLRLAYWLELKAMADRHGVRLQGYALRANRLCIPFMRAAGIPTTPLKR